MRGGKKTCILQGNSTNTWFMLTFGGNSLLWSAWSITLNLVLHLDYVKYWARFLIESKRATVQKKGYPHDPIYGPGFVQKLG